MVLPDVDAVAAALQAGEETTRTYADLSEPARDRLRHTVLAVYAALMAVDPELAAPLTGPVVEATWPDLPEMKRSYPPRGKADK
jgi:hypothetical protein